MTLFKLSLRNARRQAQDYLVYFVTIIMAAALIYAFNGLVFSEEIQFLSRQLKTLPFVIVLASIVVVCIICWLVSYAANFMLLRRSRELGMYILIGLENKQVAKLFFLENLAVGGFALFFGVLFGNLLFQALRAILFALFGMAYHFAFTFSFKALCLTLCYFLLIYLFAQLKSRKRIRTMKIYDLIYFDKQNENAVIENSSGRRRIFAASILLGVMGTVLLMMGDLLRGIVGAGCIMVFLYGFFASFSSGVPAWFEKHGARKYEGHNLLVFRTLTAKLATMGVVMATIALIFTATLISEGSGLSIHALGRERARQNTCFDLIFSSKKPESKAYTDCLNYIKENIEAESSRQYCVYLSESPEITDYIEEHIDYYRDYETDTLMRESDYAALRAMLGYPAVSLKKGQYLIHCQPYVAKALKNWKKPYTVSGQALEMGGILTERFAQYLYNVNGQGFILIVPDEAAGARDVSHGMYVALTKEEISEEKQYALDIVLSNAEEDSEENHHALDFFLEMKPRALAEAAAMTAIMVLPLFYLAMVLTMTAATILTIQQLSEMGHYRRQFELLRKLGMDYGEMRKALRTQFTIYYMLPALPPVLIGVPFVLSFVGAVEPGTMVGMSSPFAIAGMTLLLFFLIYAVYILLAYTSLKKNVLPGDFS